MNDIIIVAVGYVFGYFLVDLIKYLIRYKKICNHEFETNKYLGNWEFSAICTKCKFTP
jgi:hypothetical protein